MTNAKRRPSVLRGLPPAADTLTALVYAVACDPEDDAPRLVLADHLDDVGDARAKAVREPDLTITGLADELFREAAGRYPSRWERMTRRRNALEKRVMATFFFAEDRRLFEADDVAVFRRAKAAAALAALGWRLRARLERTPEDKPL